MAEHPRVSADELARELSDIARIADELGLTGECGAAADNAFDYLDTVRWGLADYILRGDRIRRLVNAPNPLVELADAEIGHTDTALSRTARALRARADELAAHVRGTNRVVADWLVAHRVAIVNPAYLDSNALYDRYRRGELDPATVSEDPLYLIVCHLHDVLEATADWDDADGPALQHLRAQLTLPLRAVQHEMVAALAHHAAAIGLARAVSRLEAG